MNPFIIPAVASTANTLADKHFPLDRGKELQRSMALIFSRYLGNLQSGNRFEAEGLLVTGASGSGKTREIHHLVKQFNESEPLLPSGKPARFVHCLLEGKTGWKGIGSTTLRALGYPVSDNARNTQARIWEKVVLQAKAQGVVGIHYDEAQHIFRGKSETERLAVLDSFKTLLKSHDWPLILILSGVPELAGHVMEEPQLFRLMTQLRLQEIDLPADYRVMHEIVGSFGIETGLAPAQDLMSEDFYHRLATAAANRWGVMIEITTKAITAARMEDTSVLARTHFVEAWAEKTKMVQLMNPFTHENYRSMFPNDKLFWARSSE